MVDWILIHSILSGLTGPNHETRRKWRELYLSDIHMLMKFKGVIYARWIFWNLMNIHRSDRTQLRCVDLDFRTGQRTHCWDGFCLVSVNPSHILPICTELFKISGAAQLDIWTVDTQLDTFRIFTQPVQMENLQVGGVQIRQRFLDASASLRSILWLSEWLELFILPRVPQNPSMKMGQYHWYQYQMSNVMAY